MYAAGKLCGRMRDEASMLVYAEYIRDNFKHVTNTLLYVGIRCYTANRSPNFVLA